MLAHCGTVGVANQNSNTNARNMRKLAGTG